MISIVLAMLAIMVLAASVVLFVAFPHRGMSVPHATWLGEGMRKAVNAIPTLRHEDERPRR